MPEISLNRPSPAVPVNSQASSTLAQRPSATPHEHTATTSNPTALEGNGEERIREVIQPTARPWVGEKALRMKASKLQRKATPYPSNSGFPGLQFNCSVQVRPRPDSLLGFKAVECRHLASLWLTSNFKTRMEPFSTKEGIAAQFAGRLAEIDAWFETAVREAPLGCKHLINSEQLGTYLKAMATQLQLPGSIEGPSQAGCLLVTTNHAMALKVERKSELEWEYFSAKLYDPNDTATYKRVVKVNLEDFADLQLKDMMISPQLIDLYGRREDELLSMVAVSLDHRLQHSDDKSSIPPSAQNMHLSMRCGLLEEIELMLKFALGGSWAPDERLEQPQASSLESGEVVVDPDLFSAPECAQSDTGDVPPQEGLASKNWPLSARIGLLAAKDIDGTPGLFIALEKGYPDAVRVYVREVSASKNLALQDNKIDLLVAKASDGTPGLYMALQEGHSDAVKAFTQEVLASKALDLQDKIYLLAAREIDGAPGLYAAFQAGHTEVVRTFTREVLASEVLTRQDKINLLASKRSDGNPGLYIAFQCGRSEVVKAFTQEVLASIHLTQQEKINLLAARLADGTPGLQAAFQEGCAETVEAFANEVWASSLSQEAKDSLLSGVRGINIGVSDPVTSSMASAASPDNSSHPPPDLSDRVKTKRQRTA